MSIRILLADDHQLVRAGIMHKLDIHTVAGLVKYAIREGLTSSDP